MIPKGSDLIDQTGITQLSSNVFNAILSNERIYYYINILKLLYITHTFEKFAKCYVQLSEEGA